MKRVLEVELSDDTGINLEGFPLAGNVSDLSITENDKSTHSHASRLLTQYICCLPAH
jgi:hypothetical protein